MMGNARASVRGTGSRYGNPRFLHPCVNSILHLFLPCKGCQGQTKTCKSMKKTLLLCLLYSLLLPLGAAAQEAYAVYTADSTLTFYYDNLKGQREGTTYALNTDRNDPGWYSEHSGDITKAVFMPSFADARPTSTYCWFAVEWGGTSKLATIEGLRYLNTSGVTDMSYMFFYCSSLTTLDVSDWDTGSVTNMNGMFNACGSLKTLDVSFWDTGDVTDMGSMFFGCNSLKTLELSCWDTGNVADMNSMFNGCRSLKTLYVSCWDTGNVTDMSTMFYGCSGLTTLYLSGWDTSNVFVMIGMFLDCSSLTAIYCGEGWNTDMVSYSFNMFSGCEKIVGEKGTVYDGSQVDAAYAHVDGGPGNPGYLTFNDPGGKEPYVVYNDNGTLTFCYDNMKGQRVGTKYALNTGDDIPQWHWIFTTDTRAVVFLPSFADARPTTTYNWFSFEEGYWPVPKKTIKGLRYLNTSCVTNMSYMFDGCSSLTTLDLSDWDTSNVTNMVAMFSRCSSLATLDLSGWDTGNVTNMSYMFDGCSSLTTLDLSDWDTSNVTNMVAMFSCSSLTTLDLSGWDTSNVTEMGDMFRVCRSLTTLDLSGWDTSNVTDMRSMFYYCSSLTTIYCGEGWNTGKVTYSSYMFGVCTKIVGEKGTVYDSSHVDAAYAHVDGGPANPGYLTLKKGVPTNISSSVVDMENGEETRYGLDGTRLSGKRRGVNIVRQADGSTRKVVVK